MIFDHYNRALEVTEVSSVTLGMTSTRHRLVVEDGAMVLQKASSVVDCKQKLIGLVARKPQPEPFAVVNSPLTELNPDGSYSFVPQVSGGLEDYSFNLTGNLDQGFTFDPATGALSRPPQ